MGSRILTAAAAGLSGLFVLGLVIAAAGTSPGASGGAPILGGVPVGVCAAVGPVRGLSEVQAFNAETIVAASDALSGGSAVAARMALMTAYTESGLIDLGPQPGNDGSLGLFQQRSSQGWGTPAEEVNPNAATVMFVTRLMAIPGWSTMTPWLAAQAVQRSAFADGSNYATNWALAGGILDRVDQLAGGAGCGVLAGAAPAGPAGRDGLPVGYSIPAAADPAERAVVAYALAQLGRPYVWGAAGPVAFDCSGLTMAAWATAGVALPHFAAEQLHDGTAVTGVTGISPGDLVLVPGSDGTLASPGHVGLYLGYGLVESAVDPAQGVIVQTWANFTAGGLSGVRHLA